MMTEHDGDVLAPAETATRPDGPAETRSPNGPVTKYDEGDKGLTPESGTGSSENRHRETTVGERSDEIRGGVTATTFGSMPVAERAAKAEADLNYIRDRYLSLLKASGGALDRPTSTGTPDPAPDRALAAADMLRKVTPDQKVVLENFKSLSNESDGQ